MQLTEIKSRVSALLQNLMPEHAILVGLFGVSLTHWGSNIFNSQAYIFAVFSLLALAIMPRDILIGTLGVYFALWFTVQHVGASLGWFKHGDDLIAQSADSLIWITAGLVLYNVVRHGSLSKRTWLKGIAVLATILSLIGFITYLGQGTAAATLGNQNFLGAFLAISAIACYELGRKWRLLLIPILGCLLLTKTATAIACFLIGTGVFFLGNWGILAGAVTGIVYIVLVKGGISSLMVRYGYWQDAVEKIANKWNTVVFGTGPGIYWEVGNQLHSEIAYVIWNLGMIGLVLVALYIARSLRDINNRTAYAMFIAVLVDALGNHLMHTPPTGMLAVIVFGLKDRLRIGRNTCSADISSRLRTRAWSARLAG